MYSDATCARGGRKPSSVGKPRTNLPTMTSAWDRGWYVETMAATRGRSAMSNAYNTSWSGGSQPLVRGSQRVPHLSLMTTHSPGLRLPWWW
jgi:hypothetical protein